MSAWTSIEQIGAMAAEVIAEGKDTDESSLVLTLRRVVTDSTNGPRWTATVGNYSSKACRTTEEALEEVAGMYRSALLARIERAEKKITRARAALPSLSESDSHG